MENTTFKVYIEDKRENYGKLCIEPLERGYGDTLGNGLRRLLLSSIKGAAVTAVKINGILHEFSTIKGIREDVIEILMNLKHIPIKAKSESFTLNADGFKIITLDSDDLPKDFFTRKENPGVITAGDMPWDNDFEFVGNGVLCNLEPDAHLLMEIYVEQGVGYLSAERERPSHPPLPVDAMLADAIFSPVERVNYRIEPARVGQSIDYERLILEVWTNGAITPEEAVKEAAKIAEDYFGRIAETVIAAAPFVEPAEPERPVEPVIDEPEDPEEIERFQHPIHELELSIRSENCLLRGGIQSVGELLQKSRSDLLKIRNLGKISLREIEARLDALGYELQPSEEDDEDLEGLEGLEAPEKPEDSEIPEEPEEPEAPEIPEEPKKPEKPKKSKKQEETVKPEEPKKTEKPKKSKKQEETVKPEEPKKPEKPKKSKKQEEAVKPEEPKKPEKKPKTQKKTKSGGEGKK